MSTSTSAFTGSIPENYDRYLGPLLFDPFAIDLVQSMDGRNTLSVLEIACGTGRVTKHLRSHLQPPVRIVATDLNPEMITVAKKELQDNSIEWKTANAQELPFADNSFDRIICQFGVMFFPDKPKAMREAFRVLKSGGCFLFNCWDRIENNNITCLADKVINSFFPDDPLEFYKVPFSLYNENEIRELLQEAGFKKAEITLVKKTGHSDSALHASIGMVEGNPVFLEISRKTPLLISRIREAVRKEIARVYGEENISCPLQALRIKAYKD